MSITMPQHYVNQFSYYQKPIPLNAQPETLTNWLLEYASEMSVNNSHYISKSVNLTIIIIIIMCFADFICIFLLY